MRIFTIYVIEFFQVAGAIEFYKKSICAFCPIAISPHSPLLPEKYLSFNIFVAVQYLQKFMVTDTFCLNFRHLYLLKNMDIKWINCMLVFNWAHGTVMFSIIC